MRDETKAGMRLVWKETAGASSNGDSDHRQFNPVMLVPRMKLVEFCPAMSRVGCRADSLVHSNRRTECCELKLPCCSISAGQSDYDLIGGILNSNSLRVFCHIRQSEEVLLHIPTLPVPKASSRTINGQRSK